MTTVLSEFARLSRPDGSSIFTDARLRQIAETTHISETKVAREIAIFLLHNFSIGPPFLNNSQKLQRTYNTLRDRYLAIVEALRSGSDVEQLPVIQTLLSRKSCLTDKSRILEREKKRAIPSHDEVMSFPWVYRFSSQINGAIQLDPSVYAQCLFTLIDAKEVAPSGAAASSSAGGTSSSQDSLLSSPTPSLLGRTNEPQISTRAQGQLARFFSKYVALYQADQLLTWKDLSEKWLQLGVDTNGLFNLVRQLPYSWLRTIHFSSIPRKWSPSFQTFVYDQTVEVLEAFINARLDDDLRSNLLAQMEDENFRMHLVFYLGHRDYLIQTVPDKSDPAFQWLRAIRRFLFLENKFNVIDRQNAAHLFRWVFHSQSVPDDMGAWESKPGPLPYVRIRWGVDEVIYSLVDLERAFQSDAFQNSALKLVYIFELNVLECREKTPFLLELLRSSHSLVSMKEVEDFFNFLCLDLVQCRLHLQAMNQFFRGMNAQGRAKKFLPLVCDSEWDEDHIPKARQAVLQVQGIGIQADQLLSIFLNVRGGKINQNFLTAASSCTWASPEVQREVFAGQLPSQVVCDVPRIQEASQKAQEYKAKYQFSQVETFQFYLWILSQDATSLNEKWEILTRIEIFIHCNVEKELVLSLVQAQVNTSQVVEALRALFPLRDTVLREHAEKHELPPEVRTSISREMTKIMNSVGQQEHHFNVHPAIEMHKYVSSGFLYLDLHPLALAPFFVNFTREVQMPFGQITSLKRMIRGGWRLDQNPPVFVLSFVNHTRQLRKHLEVPLQINLEDIANQAEFFQWVSEMMGEVCPDLESELVKVPTEFSRFEGPVRQFLQQLKIAMRRTVLVFANPSPFDPTAGNAPCKCFSTDECPKDLASLIIQEKQPAPFLLEFDDGHEQTQLQVRCDLEKDDPFCITLSVTSKSGRELIFPVRYLHALTRNAADFQQLLLLQVFHLKSFYYEHEQAQRTASSSAESLT